MIKNETMIPPMANTAPLVKIAPKKVDPRNPEKYAISKTIDWESRAGKFGWEYIDTCCIYPIPFVYRNGRKFCSAAMFSIKILSNFENALNNEVHSCFKVLSYPMTQAEAKLFDEINNFHCNGYMGAYSFTPNDIMLTLEDVKELFGFVQVCYNVLVKNQTNCNGTGKVGFVKIGDISMVPYVNPGCYVTTCYVPLFYFEGENECLSSKSVVAHTWNLAYLKFCFKLQGIRPQLYEGNTCKVVKLCELQKYFPASTSFRFDWPKYDAKKFLNPPKDKKENPVILNHQMAQVTENKDYKTMILPFFGKNVRCINLRPSEFTTLVLSLGELYTLFFYNVSKEVFCYALKRSKLSLYPPNRHQMIELYRNISKPLDFLDFLVLVKDVSECIGDLKKYSGL
ncbi:unnamed protein product [Brassicogethes aeneus]|uniref:Uncharacterized protein n=1 Tax=Brassicogethes aeneus TaxID=1431903 RepID=A0A9P0FPB1_BRAAE|nr:unnamed protein product [Brassicogethes aeneus]